IPAGGATRTAGAGGAGTRRSASPMPLDELDRFALARLEGYRPGEALAIGGNLGGAAIVGAHPLDLLAQVGSIRLHRHVMLPRFQAVIVPLPEAELAVELEHAAAQQHADEQAGPGIGLPVHV